MSIRHNPTPARLPNPGGSPSRPRSRAGAYAWAIACGVLVGCGGAREPVEPTKAHEIDPQESAARSAGAQSPAAPAQSAATQPHGSTLGADPAAAVADARPSPFHEWARFGTDVRIHPLGDSALLSGAANDSTLAFAFMLLSADGALTSEDRLNRGLTGFASLDHVTGTWPSEVYASYVTSNGRVGWSELIRLERTSWKVVATQQQRWLDVGVSRWDRGRLLALSFDSWRFDGRPPQFRVISGAPKGPVPKLSPFAGAAPPDSFPRCPANLVPSGFTTTDTGHTFVIGEPCAEGAAPGNLEWFAPGQAKGTLTEVPELSPDSDRAPMSAVALSPTEIYLAYGARLYQFDGSQLKHRPEIPALQLTKSKQGTLWAAAGDAVWHYKLGGTWQRLNLPPGVAALGVFAPDDSHVFVNSGKVLYALKKPTSVADHVLTWAQKPRESLRLPKPARSDCTKPFALLYAFTKVTPADFDFPLTRQAIKGQTWLQGTRFVVTEDNGKKYFGAFPTDHTSGKKLVSLIQRKVKGSIPTLLCADPKVVRELPIDLATGAVLKADVLKAGAEEGAK